MNTSLKKLEQRRKIQKIILYVLLTICAAYTLFPLLFLFINSFKGQAEIVKSPISLPKKWSFEYIATAWDKVNIVSGLINTLIITVCAVDLIVIISSLAAWVMVRSKSKFSTILFLGFTSAMLIPFQSVMYPLLSIFENLGLKNTFGLILMYGGFGLSMSVFLYHGFLKSVPKSLEEAAGDPGGGLQLHLGVKAEQIQLLIFLAHKQRTAVFHQIPVIFDFQPGLFLFHFIGTENRQQHGKKGSCLLPDSFHVGQFLHGCFQYRFQTAKMIQQPMGKGIDVNPGNGVCEQ